MLKPYSVVIATVAVTILAIDLGTIQAKPVTYDFTVDVTQGSLAGKTFNGSFTYDDKLITGVGTEVIDSNDGLSVTMTFFGKDYRETEDTDYPTFPKLTFEDGEIQQLDFWIEPGQRGLWWGRPGWVIELSPRD